VSTVRELKRLEARLRSLEDECKQELSRRRVALIGEVPWDEECLRALADCWTAVGRKRRVREAAESFPVSLAVHLVTTANRGYRGGDLWSHFPHFEARDRAIVGQAFERALRLRALERFPQLADEGAHRYVAPILAHGGVPRQLVGAFLRRLLLPALRNGEGSTAQELIARWRSSDLEGIPRPVLRFIRYGGATAVDFVARCIELTRVGREHLRDDPWSAGLPPHVVEAYLEAPEAEVVLPAKAVRPRITLDPWDDQGPQVRLPPVGRDAARGLTWVVDDGTVSEFPASPHTERVVRLGAAAYWTVAARRGGEPVRPIRVEGLGESRIICFDERGTYVSKERGLRAQRLWVILPTRADLVAIEEEGHETNIAPLEYGAMLVGSWAGYQVRHYSLEGIRLLGVRLDASIVDRIPVRGAGDQPVLVGMPVRDVSSIEDLPVYAEMPSLSLPPGSWRVILRGPGQTVTKAVDAGDAIDTIGLASLWSGLPFGSFEVLVRGSLGRDMQPTSFAVVPDLRVATPDEVIHPLSAVKVQLSAAPPVTLHPSALELNGGEDADEAWAWVGRKHKLGLVVRVPRVRWGVRHRGQEVNLDTCVLSLAPDQLGTEAEALIIETRRAGTVAQVRLEGAEGISQEKELRPSDDSGRAVLPLAIFRDTARMARAGFELKVRVGPVTVVVAEHRQAAPPTHRQGTPPLGSEVEVYVTEVHGGRLLVAGDGWTGHIPKRLLPKHPHEYREGDRLTAWVVRHTTDGIMLDAKPFDPDRFRVGDTAEADVVHVDRDRIELDVSGVRGFLYEERASAPLTAYVRGQRLQVQVIGISPTKRALELSTRHIDASLYPIGSTVRGRVLRSDQHRVWLDLGVAIGLMLRRETAPRRTPDSYRRNEQVEATVLQVDERRGHVEVSARPWRPGVNQGDRVSVRVRRIENRRVLVELPSGDIGILSLKDLPPHMASDPRNYLAKGASIPVRVKWLDPRTRKIRLAHDFDRFTFGESDESSPLSVLNKLRSQG
jgi:exosome complex RNA-binding protein Csl4